MAIFLISLLVVTCLTIYAFTSKSQPNQVVKESKPQTSAQLKPKIIIGGGVADAGDILLEPIRNAILDRAMPIQASSVKVEKAKLANAAGVIGASLLMNS
jgi:predicted NBD/HSP70 family sugar kinase